MIVRRKRASLAALLIVFCATAAFAAEVATGVLKISTLGLSIPKSDYATAPEIPLNIQTVFGGDPAGLSVTGDLNGPGITAPVSVYGTPGGTISVPALHDLGDYAITNIRLVDGGGHFLQQASPSVVFVHVVQTLGT